MKHTVVLALVSLISSQSFAAFLHCAPGESHSNRAWVTSALCEGTNKKIKLENTGGESRTFCLDPEGLQPEYGIYQVCGSIVGADFKITQALDARLR